MQPLLSALGETIVRKRVAVDLSQQELAKIAGVHRSYMSDVERGLRNITLATLESIAGALKVSSAELLVSSYQLMEAKILDAPLLKQDSM